MIPRSRTPTLLNDVTKYMDEWQSIASCHTSQLSLRDGKVLQNLRRFREAYGNILGVECAEGFVSEEPITFNLDLFLGQGTGTTSNPARPTSVKETSSQGTTSDDPHLTRSV